jgi:hypothetical protein
MDDFLKEETKFDIPMPSDVRSWTQVSKIEVNENAALKTVVRNCKLNDGSDA